VHELPLQGFLFLLHASLVLKERVAWDQDEGPSSIIANEAKGDPGTDRQRRTVGQLEDRRAEEPG